MAQGSNKVGTKVKVETRLRVLTWAVSEYAHAFGADKDCLETILSAGKTMRGGRRAVVEANGRRTDTAQRRGDRCG